MPGLFITATGTDVGKTYVAAGLIGAARRAKCRIDALKPVMSGYRDGDAESDAGRLLAALGRPIDGASIAATSPWRFAAPLAPNMAAQAENRSIDFAALVTTCRTAVTQDGLMLIEGVGGVMVPLDERHTVLDLMAALAIPMLLVSGSGLGAISYCLTSLAALKARGLRPIAIVLNETADSTVPLDETVRTLKRFGEGMPLTVIRRNAPDDSFDCLFHDLVGRLGNPLSKEMAADDP